MVVYLNWTGVWHVNLSLLYWNVWASRVSKSDYPPVPCRYNNNEVLCWCLLLEKLLTCWASAQAFRTTNEHGPQVSIGVSVEVLSLHESQVSCLCPVCRVTTGADIIALDFVAAMTIAQKFAPCNWPWSHSKQTVTVVAAIRLAIRSSNNVT